MSDPRLSWGDGLHDLTHWPQGFPRAGKRRSPVELAVAVAGTVAILGLAAIGVLGERRTRPYRP